MNEIEGKNCGVNKCNFNSNIQQISKTRENISDTLEFHGFKEYVFKLFKTKYRTIVSKNHNKNTTKTEYNKIRHDIFELFNKYFETKLAEKDKELMKIIEIYSLCYKLEKKIIEYRNKYYRELKPGELIRIETTAEEINIYNEIGNIIETIDSYKSNDINKKILKIGSLSLPSFFNDEIIDTYRYNLRNRGVDIGTAYSYDFPNEKTNLALDCLEYQLNYDERRSPYSRLFLFEKFLEQLPPCIDKIILDYFSKDEGLIKGSQTILRQGKFKVQKSQLGSYVINEEDDKSGHREFTKLGHEIPQNLISSTNEEIFKQNIEKCLNEIYSQTPYNTLDYVVQTIKIVKEEEKKTQEEAKEEQKMLWDTALDLAIQHKNEFEGDICVGMSQKLKESLSKKGIKCELIRFKAARTANNDCSGDGHVGVMISYKTVEDEKEKLVRVDPGLGISSPVYFQKAENISRLDPMEYPKYIVESNSEKGYPDKRYCVFITKSNDYTCQILGLQKSKDYSVKIDKGYIEILKDKEKLLYENGELKDENEQIYKVSYNLDVLRREFPYKLYVYGKNNGEQSESIYYISKNGSIFNYDNPSKYELDLNKSIENPEDTIGRDYFRVMENLSFVRYDNNGKKIASIRYPIRGDETILLKSGNKRIEIYNTNGEKGISFDRENRITIKNISDLPKILLQIKSDKLNKLLIIAHELRYHSPFLDDQQSYMYGDILYSKLEIRKDSLRRYVSNNFGNGISDEERKNYIVKDLGYLYNIVYSLLEISKNYEDFVNYCGVAEKESNDFSIPFDHRIRGFNKGVIVADNEEVNNEKVNKKNDEYEHKFIVNGEVVTDELTNRYESTNRYEPEEDEHKYEHRYIDYKALEFTGQWKKGEQLSLNLSYLEHINKEELKLLGKLKLRSLSLNGLKTISKDELNLLLQSGINELNLNGITELGEGVAEVLGKSKLMSLSLNGLKTISKDELNLLLQSGINELNLNGITELGEGVAEVLGKSKLMSLSLNGLKTIKKEELKSLWSGQIAQLSLNGLTELGEGVAEELGKSIICSLRLDNLKKISKKEAEVLGGIGYLSLRGLTKLGEGVAEELGRSNIKFLNLDGLKSITKKQVRALLNGKIIGLSLKGLLREGVDEPFTRYNIGIQDLSEDEKEKLEKKLTQFCSEESDNYG